MYLLWSPTQLLRKAGKQGLIAIQRQVTKKGKTFTQTFYVKPESASKDLDAPKQITVPEREVIHITTGSGKFEFESNRPEGGFYISMPGSRAVKVPTKLIEKVMKVKGHTFILHRLLEHDDIEDTNSWSWSSEFRVTELSTGLYIGMGYDNIKGTETSFRDFIEGKPQHELDSVIDEYLKVWEIENVITDTSGWAVKDVKHKLTDKEISDVARNLWMDHFQGDYDMGRITDATNVSNIESWLKDIEGIETNEALQESLKHINVPKVLAHAVKYDLNYNDAFNSLNSIDDILSEILNADLNTDITHEDVVKWAHEYEEDLMMGYSSYTYGVSDNHGDEKWSPAEIAKYAIEDGMTLQEAQTGAQQEVDEDSDGEESFEDINITDSYGMDWEYIDIRSISSWVGGAVDTTRSLMKDMDGIRRRNIGAGVPEQNAESITGGIISAIESHSVRYNKYILYRGTKNPAWGDLNVGDSIPLGMASFSKSVMKARSFSGENNFIIVLDGKDITNPVMGVDIDGLLIDIRNAGYSEGVSKYTNLDAYEDEKEFLVRAPSLVVTEIDNESDIPGIEGYRTVHMKPAEMDMLEFMKSLFEDATSAAERTFDCGLHREPEDEWN